MDANQAVAALSALAHEHRLAAYRLLVERGPEGLAAGAIAERLGMPPSSLTFHLQHLHRAGLVTQRRMSRQIIYAADFAAMNGLVGYLTDNCCGGDSAACATGGRCLQAAAPPGPRERAMTQATYNLLFLCTGNSARSIMTEAYLNSLGRHIRGFSAGSHPKGSVHPLAIERLRQLGIPTAGLRSKSWDEFAAPGAPKMDFIVTVCDQAASEMCPVWPGHPVTANWGIPDPAAVEGSDAERRAAFVQAFGFLKRRIDLFLEFRIEHLDRLSIKKRLAAIGLEPAS